MSIMSAWILYTINTGLKTVYLNFIINTLMGQKKKDYKEITWKGLGIKDVHKHTYAGI